jgi:hypothetical protein
VDFVAHRYPRRLSGFWGVANDMASLVRSRVNEILLSRVEKRMGERL